MMKQIEKVWWFCAIGNMICGIAGLFGFEMPIWTIWVALISFFGFWFSSLAWLFASHVEYMRNLEQKVKELEKQSES
jgi:phage shock protein PspC (stress-responsive transcriptional regulator)